MSIRRLTTLLCLLASAGCTFIPRYERPATPVPATFPSHENADSSGSPASAPAASAHPASATTVASDIASNDFFAEARLKRLIQLALENNRDLRIAVLNVEQNRAEYGITRSAVFPTVQANGSYARQSTSLATGTSGVAAGNSTFTSSSWSAGAGISAYELDLFGRVRSQTAQALEQYFATEEARRAAQVILVGEVATQYFTLRQAQEQLQLARVTLEAVQASYALNKATFDAGQSNELDLRQSEGQVETSQLNLQIYQRQVTEARHALELLLGAPLPADLPAEQPFSDTGLVAEVPPGLPSDLVERRPDILQAEHSLKAANANIGVARAAFFPTISLTGSAGFSSSQLSSLFKAGSREWSFAPQVSVPIFTGGKNRAQLESARAGERIQVATYEKAIQSAFREVADALIEVETYSRQIEIENALIKTQQRRLELATLRYRQGEDTYLSELTAQQDLYTAQQGLLQAQFNKLAGQIALYRALGGGWK